MSDVKKNKKEYAKPELAVIDLVGDSILAACMNTGHGDVWGGGCKSADCKATGNIPSGSASTTGFY